MNILVIAPFGMYQNYTASFVHNQAKAYVRQGHHVRAIVPLAFAKRSNKGTRFGAPVEIVEQDGVEIYYVRYLSLSSWGHLHFNANARLSRFSAQLFFARLLKDFQPDVIHAHTIGYGGTVALYFKRKCHVPLVITTHGGDTDLAIEKKNLASSKMICGQADAVVAVSTNGRRKIEQIGADTQLLSILNGFDVQNVRSSCHVPHRIIQVGNLLPSKRNHITIRAVSKLRERYPDISLVIIGKGPERESLESLCRSLKMEEAVQFLGYLPNNQAMAEMAKAELFIMPSSPEGFGIVYLEAMASGCVAVGTEGEGIADVIISGENGFLVPADDVDAVVRVVDFCLQNPENASMIAERGRQEAMTLTWENNTAQYLDLFQSLLKGNQIEI